MKKSELKKNVRVWCWWKSRYLYYEGKQLNGYYKFVDITGDIFWFLEKGLEDLEIK